MSNNDNVTALRDEDYAAQAKAKMRELLAPVCDLLNDAQRRGLKINFGIGLDPYGRSAVQAVEVIRPL